MRLRETYAYTRSGRQKGYTEMLPVSKNKKRLKKIQYEPIIQAFSSETESEEGYFEIKRR